MYYFYCIETAQEVNAAPSRTTNSLNTTTTTTVIVPTTTTTTIQPSIPPQANCSFETSLCGYNQIHTSRFFFSWHRVKATDSTILNHAHKGVYVYLQSNNFL